MSTRAGWYPQPGNPRLLRYWDGQAWTSHTAPTPHAQDTEPTLQLPQEPLPPPPPPGFEQPAGGHPLHPASTAQRAPEPWHNRPWPVAAVLAVVAVVGFAVLGDDKDTEPASADLPAPAVTVTVEPTPTSEPDESATEETVDNNGSSQVGSGGDDVGDGANTFRMPDETGKNLQAAQDDLQAISGNPFFFSASEDATGQDRVQVWDANWKVCSQDPRPGSVVRDDEDDVVFYVVSNEESCP